MTTLEWGRHQILIRKRYFSQHKGGGGGGGGDWKLCPLAQAALSPRLNGLAFSDAVFQTHWQGVHFVFLNGHYLVVIRYCQSVRGKQRVLKESLGNKSLQLKSQACVCNCHLLSSPWERVTRPSTFLRGLGTEGTLLKWQYVICLLFLLLHCHTVMYDTHHGSLWKYRVK